MNKLWWLLAIILCLAGAGIVIFGIPQAENRSAIPLANKPARIVSLAPNLTEILFALELDEQIVAVSNDSDYPLKAANKKKIGTFWQPNTEAIIACRPDLVVTLWFEQQKVVAAAIAQTAEKEKKRPGCGCGRERKTQPDAAQDHGPTGNSSK